jgi:hypothetical protein
MHILEFDPQSAMGERETSLDEIKQISRAGMMMIKDASS